MKKSDVTKRKSHSKQEMDELFADLKKEYLSTFNDKQILIQKAWVAYDRKTLENEFHKMKGTGKTYGLPEVSDLGGMIELLCKDNHPKLGLCVFLALEILPKIVAHHNNLRSYLMSEDPFYKKIKEIYCELATLAS